MSILIEGEFKSSAGLTLPEKFELERGFDEKDWRTAAFMIKRRVNGYSRAVGVPKGGTELAFWLNEIQHDTDGPILVVDDVYTTGRSLMKELAQHPSGTQGFVVISRSTEPLPINVRALFQLDSDLIIQKTVAEIVKQVP